MITAIEFYTGAAACPAGSPRPHPFPRPLLLSAAAEGGEPAPGGSITGGD